MNENIKELSILVLSCDKYADLWDTFFDVFEKNWPDCNYDIYLGSNSVEYDRENVKVLFTGEDKDWSSSARKIVEQIESKYVLIFLEDMLVGSKIDNDYVDNILSFMKEKDVKHLHVRPLPKADKIIEYNDIPFGIYEKSMPYRVNVIAFWEREYFLNLLINGESPWNFEIMGSYRTSYDDGFFTLQEDLYTHVNMVEKGKWILNGLKWCEENDVKVDFSKRGNIENKDIFISNIKKFYFQNIVKVPWKLRLKLMNIFRKAIVSY
jgi:hypothetical protein